MRRTILWGCVWALRPLPCAVADPTPAHPPGFADARVAGSSSVANGRHLSGLTGEAGEDAHHDEAPAEEHAEEDAHHDEAPAEEHAEEAHGDDHSEGHAEEEHGEGGHHKVTKTSFTIALMLMMFFVLNMFLLYMVNYRDPNVRSYIFKMLDSMISIFVAVVFNEAMFGFFFDQILPSPPPRGFGLPPSHRQHFVVGVLTYLLFSLLLNVAGFRFQDDPTRLYGYRKMLGHISAFAGIMTFSHLQSIFHFPIVGVVVAFFIMAVNLSIWDRWREKKFKPRPVADDDGEDSRSVEGGLTYALVGQGNEIGKWQVMLEQHWCDYPSDINDVLNEGMQDGLSTILITLNNQKYQVTIDSHGKGTQKRVEGYSKEREVRYSVPEPNNEWKEDVFESELDATCLVLSFLTLQYCLFLISGKMPALHAHDAGHPKPGYLSKLLIGGAFFLIAVVILTIARGLLKGHSFMVPGSLNRMMNGLQTYLAMCMSWCLLTVGHWAILQFLKDAEMAMVVNAFVLTGLAVFVVVVLDMFADSMLERSGKLNRIKENDSCEMDDDGIQRTGSGFGDADSKMVAAFGHAKDTLQDATLHEKALRKIIESAGLLVGIVWEKALAAANVSLENFIPFTSKHIVVTKISLATLIVVLVMPAYLRHIVPVARRTWRNWARIMRTEDLQPVLEKLHKCDYVSVNLLLNRLDQRSDLLEEIEQDIKGLQYIRSKLKSIRKTASMRSGIRNESNQCE